MTGYPHHRRRQDLNDHPLSSTPLLAIVACLLWSTAFVGVKIGLQYCGPLAFAGIRFMLSGLLLVPLWWSHRPRKAAVINNAGLILKLGFFQTFTLYGLFYFGMTLVPGALAAMVIGASPLVTAVLAHYCIPADRMTSTKAISLLLGLFGVTILSFSRLPWASATGLLELAGIGILLLANLAGAMGNIMVSRHRADLEPVFLNSAQIFVGGLGLWLLSLPLEEPLSPFKPWPFWASLAWLAFLSAAAFSIWFKLLRRPHVKVSELNLWKFLIPVCGALLSWLMLPEESPSFWPLAGMGCISLGIIIFNIPAWRSTNSDRPAH
jgi:drug/metabolite transporter (DMT)-like permease